MNQVKVGEKFWNNIGFVDRANPLILPSENTTGIVIRTCINSGGKILSGTVTPVFATLTKCPMIYSAEGAAPFEIVIPAGQGVWYAAFNSNSSLYITYDVLA